MSDVATQVQIDPYYQKDGITIYCADCVDVLAQMDRVDITVTSPPYNMIKSHKPSGMMAEFNCKKYKGYNEYRDDLDQSEYEDWINGIIGKCLAVSYGLVWVNHKIKYIDKKGRHPLRYITHEIHSEVIWDRGCTLSFGGKRHPLSHEGLYAFGTPHYWDKSIESKMTVWRIMPERNIKNHPCPFPLEIPKRCIISSCPPGGVVLDPFMGSGTTMVAARDLGMQAVGIEKDKVYCDVAIERLSQGVLF